MVGDILQPTHLLFILVVALLVLGPKRLPEVGRTLGSGLRDFSAAINGESHDDPAPRAYVETEPDRSRRRRTRSETEPAGFDLGDRGSGRPSASETEPATPTALHEHQLDPNAPGDDLHAPDAIEDLHPPAQATICRRQTTCTHPPQPTARARTGRRRIEQRLRLGAGLVTPAARRRGEPTADDE